ncbi:bifunctional diguanylate cyclase/phosphodiesterase [Clostridium akagii]|uniref:bifunctional diguanylate cyclase/phosphodiesterase n=1 Tax=Clostridium akagii TaxID=91623 RepID=UPI00047D05E6|nr:bifunctional diguanylate cyclase/phosphodiesterase [Clostridium akagii]
MEFSCTNVTDIREVYNINYSVRLYKKLINESNRQRDPFAVCLIDISNFKNYNYIYGYEFGNLILDMVFRKIKMYTDKNGYVCRYGGNVFLVILDKVSSRDEVIKIVTNIEMALKNTCFVEDVGTKILVNIGISIYPSDSENVENILQCAEMSLNYSKRMDVYSHCFFNEKMHKSVIKAAGIHLDLMNSVYEDEFMAYYQPEYDAKTMKIVGAEALIRWDTASLGTMPGKDFINIALKNGSIKDIGRVLIKKVCTQLKEIQKAGNGNMTISINMSEKQLIEKNFLSFINEVLLENDIRPSSIIIELPEKMLTRIDERTIRVIAALRRSGIKIFLDDFGAKYSSINHLFNIPIDGIKIDSAIINTLGKDERSKVVFKNIMNMANELGIEVRAKGIQRKSHIKYFQKMGCKRLQGCILSKVLDEQELIKILQGEKI